MLKNEIDKDIKKLLIEKDMTQAELGEAIGSSGPYVNRLLQKGTPVNPMFLKMCEELGYDVEIRYVERPAVKKMPENKQER